MGRDNQPKERQRRDLARKQGSRASYDRILIVSEGSRTEPGYFREIRARYQLNSTNVVVQPSSLGTEPLQVVEYACRLFDKGDANRGIGPKQFERIYAVFDRDEHGTFHDALTRARALDGTLKNDLRKPVRFAAIPSRPSFEFWLLLHFENVQHLLHRDEATNRLKRYLPEYSKAGGRIFEQTSPKLSEAMDRARKLAGRADIADDTEPYTAVFQLVEVLLSLGK